MPTRRVSDPTPVQAYLAPEEYEALERLVDQLGTSKSDVIRRGIRAVEREFTDPHRHPALRLIGIAERKKSCGGKSDPARDHDRHLVAPCAQQPHQVGPFTLARRSDLFGPIVTDQRQVDIVW